MQTIKIPFRRGTTAQNDAYRGGPGEISIDTTKNTIRVHDGVNFGGEELLTKTDLEVALESTSNYDRRFDIVSPTIIYRGVADAGTSENASEWRICRLEVNYSTNVVTKTWAGGSKGFTNKWTDRATYSYTL